MIPSTGVAWGFTGQDVFSNAVLIVASLASFIILSLAVSFAPQIISLIRSVFAHDELAEIDDEEVD